MADSTLLLGSKVIIYAAYRRCTTRQLFSGGKAKTLLGHGDALRPRPTFEAKSRQKLPEGFRSPRRNKLRYAQYNQRLNCCTLRYCSLIEKILGFFRRGEAAKSSRAVVLTIAYRFEPASTMAPAEGCSFKNESTLIFTLGPGQERAGLPLSQLRRKLLYKVPLKKSKLTLCSEKTTSPQEVFSEHSIVPMERYTLCLALVSK